MKFYLNSKINFSNNEKFTIQTDKSINMSLDGISLGMEENLEL